jgi:hypothetical protein
MYRNHTEFLTSLAYSEVYTAIPELNKGKTKHIQLISQF